MESMESTTQKKPGAVDHILRQQFADLFSSNVDPSLDHTSEATGLSDEADLVPAKSSGLAEEEIRGIDARRSQKLADLDGLQESLAYSAKVADQFDRDRFAELRKLGLVQGYEIPLERSPPRTAHRRDLAASQVGWVVSPSTVLHAVDKEIAVRTGQVREGEDAPDFYKTAGEPRYLATTAGREARVAYTAKQAVETVGGFGPAFHRTGQPGLVDIPSTSGHAGVSVSRQATGLNPHSIAGASSGLRKKAKAGMTGPAGPGLVKGYKPSSGAPSSSAVEGKAVSLEEQLERDMAQAMDREQPEQEEDEEQQEEEEAGPLGATGRLRATVSNAAAAVPEGVAGVRGEGLRASVTRTSRLEYARQHAGAGTAGALSERDIGANAAIVDRMQRPQQYTRASRHDAPPSRSSLLTAGGGRKGTSTAGQPLVEVEARAATEHMAVRSVSPPKVLGHVNPGRKRRGAPTATPVGQGGKQQWQTLETGRGASARTGLLGLNAALEHAQPAFLPSRGGLQSLRITREALPGASLPSEGMAGCFSVSPSAVRFPEYEAGTTHTMVISVRNVDSVMRHLRVLPPATRVFRCDVSAFPGAAGPEGVTSARGRDGLLLPTGKAGSPIAPGMAVKLTITFTPPTPTPFTDSVTLVTEAGQYTLPLLASVAGPELSLPLTVPIGACMKFDVLSRQIPAKNVGSKATFRLLPAEVFDAVSEGLLSLDLGVSGRGVGAGTGAGLQQGRPSLSAGDGPQGMETLCSLTVPAPDGESTASDGGEGSATSTCGLRRVHAESLELWSGPFRVWPTIFELGRGESIDLNVLYRPTEHGVHARRLALVGSDGSVFSYTLTAECAPLNVSIASLQAILLPEPLRNGVQYAPVVEYGKKEAYHRLLQAPAQEAAPDFLSAALGSALAAVVTGADRDAAQLADPSRTAPAPRSEVRNPAQKLRFDDIHPGTSQSKSITVRNDSPLPVRYSWAVHPQEAAAPKLPLLDVLGLDPKQGHMRLLNRAAWGAELQQGDPSDVGREAPAQPAPPVPAPFHVEPSEGMLQGYSTATFAVTFAPTVTARAGDGSPGVVGGYSVQPQPCSWSATAVLSVHDVPVDPSAAAAARQAAAVAASEERIQAQVKALRRASKPGTWTPALTPRAGGGAHTPVASAAADRHGHGGGLKSRPSSAAAEVASLVVLKQDELGLTALTMGLSNAPDSGPSSSSPGTGPFVGSMTAFAVDSATPTSSGLPGGGVDSQGGDRPGAERELGPGGPRPVLGRGAYGQVDTIRVNLDSHTVDSVVQRSSIAMSVLALHGCSKAAEVVLEPSSIQVPGPLLPAYMSAGATRLVNNGDGPVSFVVLEQRTGGTAADGCDVTVEPRAGVLGARQSIEVHATFTGRQPGEHTAVFPVHMFYGAEVGQAAQAVLEAGGHLSEGLVSALRSAHIAPEDPPAPSVELTLAPASPRAPGAEGGVDAQVPGTAAVPASHYISRSTPFNGGVGGVRSPEGAAPGSPISVLVSNGLAELVHMCGRASAAVQQLTVRGTVRYPNVAWSAARLDAGLLGCERTATHTLRVVNVDDCPVRWVAHRVTPLPASGEDTHVPEAKPDGDRRTSNMYLHPASGVLGPGDACDICLTLDTAILPEHLEGVLRVVAVPFEDDTAERAAAKRQSAADSATGRARGKGEVEAVLSKPYELAELPVASPRLWGQGQAHPLHPALLPVPSFLRLTGEVQAPLVSLSCTAWKLGTLFVGMPVRRQVTLTNLCDLPVDYSWDPYVGAKPPLPIEDPGWELVDAALEDVRRLLRSDGKKRLFPSLVEVAFVDGCSGGKGSLGPRESVTLTLSIIGKHAGSVSSLLAVDVPGMQEPLGLALSATVLGVTARYSVVEDGTGRVVPPAPPLPSSTASKDSASAGPPAPVESSSSPSPGIGDTPSSPPATVSLKRPASTGALSSTPSSAARATAVAAARARESRATSLELGSVDVDGELEQHPTVVAMREAQARAAILGATHARLPALLFGTADAPLSTHTRKSYTLHILNMSGIPTTFTAAVSSYAAAEPASLLAAQAAVRSESTLATPSGHGHNSTFITPRGTPWLGGMSSPDAGLNWPALYDAAERISAVDKVAAARTAVRRGFVPAEVAQGIAESLQKGGGQEGTGGRSTASRSLSPVRGGGLLVPRPARYGVQHVPPAGVGGPLGPPFAFAVAPTSVVTPQGTLAYGGSLASHLAVTGGAAHRAHGQGTGRRPSAVAHGEAPLLALPATLGMPGGESTSTGWSPRDTRDTGGSPSSRSGRRTKSASPSRPRRPRLFLTASHESTQKFASAAGRQASEQQEVERLHRAALATGTGLALQLFPRQGALPPFGHAAVQVAAVGDWPGEYSDTLTVHVEGCEPLSVPLTAVLSGCPLALVGQAATLGLADEGAAGSTGPTLAFGDCPQGGAPLLKTVTVENRSPLDAHVLVTLGPDPAPGARFGHELTTTTSAPPPAQLLQEGEAEAQSQGGAGTSSSVPADSASSLPPAAGPEGGSILDAPASPPPQSGAAEEGKEGEAAPQPATPRAETGAPVLDRAAIRAALAATDLPFTVQPQLLLIPAYGKATVRVSGTPRLMRETDVRLSSALGWEGRWLHYLRARIVGHAVYTPAGEAPPGDLLRKLGSLGPLVDAPEGPWLDITAKEAEASDRSLSLWTDVDAGRPTQRPLAQAHALVLHTSIRPFLPALTLDKHSLADGKPWVKFSVWSTALEDGASGGSAVGSGIAAVKSSKASAGGAGPGGSMNASGQLAFNAGLHPSCAQQVMLTNSSGAELPFFLTVDGPFVLLKAETSAPTHPISRLDLLSGPSSAGDATSQGRMAALFPVDAMPPGTRVHSLPPGCSLAVTLAFSPEAGRSMRATAAQMFFTSHGAAANSALSATATGPALSGSATLSMTGGREGTVTLGGTGGLAGARTGGGSSSDVQGLVAASITRLKGEYTGMLRATYSTGATQEIGLRAEVLRPAVQANPGGIAFGVVRAGGGARVAALALTNPTAVTAEWAIRHVPAPTGPLAARVQPGSSAVEVDWRSLGLDPGHPLWADSMGQPGEAILDEPGVFAFTALSGALQGPTVTPDTAAAATLRHSDDLPLPTTLDVRFAPPRPGLYQCRYRVSVKAGEAVEILLRGRGTLEEIDGTVHADMVADIETNVVGPQALPLTAGSAARAGAVPRYLPSAGGQGTAEPRAPQAASARPDRHVKPPVPRTHMARKS